MLQDGEGGVNRQVLVGRPLSTFPFQLLPLRPIITRIFIMDGTNAQSAVSQVSLLGRQAYAKTQTPLRVMLPQADLHDARLKVENHIKNICLKQVQAPVGVKPVLKCWLELN